MNITYVLTERGDITKQYPLKIFTDEEVNKYNKLPFTQRLGFLHSLRIPMNIRVMEEEGKINWDLDKVLHQIILT